MAEESKDYRWLVRCVDMPDSAAKRDEFHAAHAARLKHFKQEHPGVLEYGGPILEMEGVKAKGSILHLLYGEQFDTLEKVKAFLDQDPFVKNNVYDPSRRTIELYHAKHFPLSMK